MARLYCMAWLCTCCAPQNQALFLPCSKRSCPLTLKSEVLQPRALMSNSLAALWHQKAKISMSSWYRMCYSLLSTVNVAKCRSGEHHQSLDVALSCHCTMVNELTAPAAVRMAWTPHSCPGPWSSTGSHGMATNPVGNFLVPWT